MHTLCFEYCQLDYMLASILKTMLTSILKTMLTNILKTSEIESFGVISLASTPEGFFSHRSSLINASLHIRGVGVYNLSFGLLQVTTQAWDPKLHAVHVHHSHNNYVYSVCTVIM